MKPTFIDNQGGNTLASAIKTHLNVLREKDITPDEICISTAFFNPQGFERILSEIKQIPEKCLDHIPNQTPSMKNISSEINL